LMGGIVETTVAPAKLYRKSARGLHINVNRLTIRVPASPIPMGALWTRRK
jgi:hypothetical protein